MLLTEYVKLTLPLVRNQFCLVDACGYCIHWNGELTAYATTDDLIDEIRSHMQRWIEEGSLEADITIDEAIRIYHEE